jgi:NAD(P)H-nitrite reductase large subunit
MTMITKSDYLIFGNSVGGIGAAEAIRSTDGAGPITIVSDEPYLVYSRPLISDYLAHPGPIEKMLYRMPGFYEKNGVRTVLGEKALKIDPEGRTVTLSGGQTLAWRKLLLATGGTPIVPATPGADLSGVFTFNKLNDAKAIDEYLKMRRNQVNAVVIGGGLIGASITEALVKRGVRVTVIEMKDRILNTILDEEASTMEAQSLAQYGVNIITRHTVDRISSRIQGEVGSVTLDDGRLLACEMVVIAIGVRPRMELAKESGIETNRGIVVDRFMMTSAPDIYACGDAAEAYDFVLGEDRLIPVWPNAYEGGRVAGLNMAGVPTEYEGGTAMNAMKYFGLNIVSAGMATPPDASYESLSNRHNGIYRKVIIKNGKLYGFIFAGDIAKSGIVYSLLKDRIDVTDFKEALVADNFGLASLPEALWRQRLPGPASGSVMLSGAAEKPEEALIGG